MDFAIIISEAIIALVVLYLFYKAYSTLSTSSSILLALFYMILGILLAIFGILLCTHWDVLFGPQYDIRVTHAATVLFPGSF